MGIAGADAGETMTSLKDSARHAFQEEPPWPEEHIVGWAEDYIRVLQEQKQQRVGEFIRHHANRQFVEGFEAGFQEVLRFLRGEQQT